MIQSILIGGGFYFSRTMDLSRNLQWLSENTTPAFRQMSMIDRVGILIYRGSQVFRRICGLYGMGTFLMN